MVTVKLSASQLRAVLWAVGNYTDGNARDLGEMMREGMSRSEALALLSAEGILQRALRRNQEVA